MEVLPNEFRVIEPDSQRKCLGEPLMLLVDHVCRLQERYIILWRK
jgi:hypothetical protein